jgi:hypothetical protein
MSLRGGRPRRPDAWSDAHARARFRAAERLDGPLDPTESAWLDDHLASCRGCRQAAASYTAQRVELRSLADHAPGPPRDLWARTAAAIEREGGFRDRSRGRRTGRARLAPYALLTAALVVAVAVGTLNSSWRLGGGGPAASSVAAASESAPDVAVASSRPGATPVVVGPKKVEWITQDTNGNYSVQSADISEVCPAEANPCGTAASTNQRPLEVTGRAQTVIGSRSGNQLIVVAENGPPNTGTVSVLTVNPSESTPPSASPSGLESLAPSQTATASATIASPSVRPTPSPTVKSTLNPTPSSSPVGQPASPSPTPSTSPAVEVSPSATPSGSVQIAHDVIVVGQTAAYSASGAWFAFTARPADRSAGTDIYLWRVGDPLARPVTKDHRSELGSWSGDTIVASTAIDTPGGTSSTVFLLDPATVERTVLPQAGNAWRPSVDPESQRAVYWTGRLRLSDDGKTYAPDAGRLVLGKWTSADTVPSDGPAATAPSDQEHDRQEVTIAAGNISDWDARWDETGTRLAIWIADPDNPGFGVLSLYAVSPFDGKIDLRKPLLDGRIAKAGYAISEGKLVWAEPASGGIGTGRILVYGWSDKGSGTIEPAPPGQVIVVR